MNQTLKVSFAVSQPVRQDGFGCRDKGPREKPLGSQMAKANALHPPPRFLSGCPVFVGAVTVLNLAFST